MPPVEFGHLPEVLRDGEVRVAIDGLLGLKSRGVELDDHPRIEPLHRFIDAELSALEHIKDLPHRKIDTAALDRVFLATLCD